MSQAQFTIPLIVVIPGQLITASLWNNEFTNLQTNLNPSGIGGYEDTDAIMQIQTAPYPGSITSHATSLAGEIERIRYQISAILGPTTPAFWYAAPPTNLSSLNTIQIPIGAVIDYPTATPPNSNYLLANGQAIGRVAYASLFTLVGTTFGVGDGTTTFNIPNYTDRMAITAGNLYAVAATGGAVSNTPTISITDPGHNHTQNTHTHTMANHTHSDAHTHELDFSTTATGTFSPGNNVIATNNASGNDQNLQPFLNSGASDGITKRIYKSGTGSQSSSTSGTPSPNTSDATTPTNNSNTTGITGGSTSVPTLPPYLAMYKIIRVL